MNELILITYGLIGLASQLYILAKGSVRALLIMIANLLILAIALGFFMPDGVTGPVEIALFAAIFGQSIGNAINSWRDSKEVEATMGEVRKIGGVDHGKSSQGKRP